METALRDDNYYDYAGIRTAWQELKSRRKVRNRDAADLLGISEAELLASNIGDDVVLLAGDFRTLLKRVPEVGRVMALTRNESCVHEKTGVYENLSADGMVGLALGSDIDLRLFFMHWKHGFALTEPGVHGVQRSLQFFDGTGTAVHKIYLRDDDKLDAWTRLVADFTAPTQQPGLALRPVEPARCERPDDLIDASALRSAWAELKDTHEFFGLLKKFDVTRTQAMRLAGSQYAYPAPLSSVRELLDDVAASALPIMVFAGNRGCIQIHTGPVRNVKVIDSWVNVLDPGFNLHLRQDHVASAWVVKKPTTDGIVTSLELFDRDGETIAMLFGERKPGRPELPAWQHTIERLFPSPVEP